MKHNQPGMISFSLSSLYLLNPEGLQFPLQPCPQTMLQLLAFFTCRLELYEGLLHLLHLIYIHLLLFQLKFQGGKGAMREQKRTMGSVMALPNPALCLDLFLSRSKKRMNGKKVLRDEWYAALYLAYRECDEEEELAAPFYFCFFPHLSVFHRPSSINRACLRWQAFKIIKIIILMGRFSPLLLFSLHWNTLGAAMSYFGHYSREILKK